VPGDKTPTDAGPLSDLGGIQVRTELTKMNPGYQRQLDWTANDSRYILDITDAQVEDGQTYSPSTADLAWLVPAITARYHGNK
jgi:hypothetical protein